MNIKSDIQTKVEKHLGEGLIASTAVSGGCIADSKIIKTQSGKSYFLKTHAGNRSMFLKEANGLKELAKAKAIRIPEVVIADKNFLLLENIEQGPKTGNFFTEFGASYANMHRYTSGEFGFYEDNFIGATPQYNIPENKERLNWPEFYYQKRLLPQLKFAEQNRFATNELIKNISSLENKIQSILEGSEEPPTLLHGDLWGGNYLCDNNGNAVLIDPAAYYGHREADLAMTRMFGGFSSEFYHAYQHSFALKEGWEYREGMYLLYHHLNHLNLFGNSYYSGCIGILRQYI